MIGPNGSGKSSVFDALNFYTYIIENNAYPSDDTDIGPYEPMHMMNYYLKNNFPRPIPRLSDDGASLRASKELIEECKGFYG